MLLVLLDVLKVQILFVVIWSLMQGKSILNVQFVDKLVMKKHNFWKFFYLHGGKLKQTITKPRLTTEQIKERLKFSNKWINKMNEKDVYICFLDEKWFYTNSRRKKMKVLPQAQFETADQAFIPKPKLRSHRFPCKVMFMGLVCPPCERQNRRKNFIKESE